MRRWRYPVLVCLALGAEACSSPAPEPVHYLRVQVETELSTPDDLDHLQIVVERQGVPLFSKTYDQETLLRLRQHDDSLIIDNPSPSNDSPDKLLLTVKPIQITVLGYHDQEVRIARSASVQFNDGQRRLSLPLCRACLGMTSCPEGQTCKRGQCQGESVDASALPHDDAAPDDVLAECGAP